VPLTRERWELSDGDFVDVDRMSGPNDAPLLLLLHGLEGSSSAHYIRGLLAQAAARHWRALALNFRGCSGDMNRLCVPTTPAKPAISASWSGARAARRIGSC